MKIQKVDNEDLRQKKVGQTISLLRRIKGLTQKQLASEIGKSHVYVSQLERGDRPVNNELKKLIANKLDVSLLEFDACLIVFSGISVESNIFTPNQIEFLSTLQKLVSDNFNKI